MSLEPAIAALTGLALLGEAPDAREWAAIGCVIVACAGAPGAAGAGGRAGHVSPPPS